MSPRDFNPDNEEMKTTTHHVAISYDGRATCVVPRSLAATSTASKEPRWTQISEFLHFLKDFLRVLLKNPCSNFYHKVFSKNCFKNNGIKITWKWHFFAFSAETKNVFSNRGGYGKAHSVHSHRPHWTKWKNYVK